MNCSRNNNESDPKVPQAPLSTKTDAILHESVLEAKDDVDS